MLSSVFINGRAGQQLSQYLLLIEEPINSCGYISTLLAVKTVDTFECDIA